MPTRSLLETVRHAVALQPAAEAALAGLSTGTDPVGPWAHQASRISGRYWELLQDLPSGNRLAELLDYHQQVLRHTMRFACSLDHLDRRAALSARQAGGGLGAPGEELREMLRVLEEREG